MMQTEIEVNVTVCQKNFEQKITKPTCSYEPVGISYKKHTAFVEELQTWSGF